MLDKNRPLKFASVKVKVGWVVQNMQTNTIVLVCKTQAQAETIAKKLNS